MVENSLNQITQMKENDKVLDWWPSQHSVSTKTRNSHLFSFGLTLPAQNIAVSIFSAHPEDIALGIWLPIWLSRLHFDTLVATKFLTKLGELVQHVVYLATIVWPQTKQGNFSRQEYTVSTNILYSRLSCYFIAFSMLFENFQTNTQKHEVFAPQGPPSKSKG